MGHPAEFSSKETHVGFASLASNGSFAEEEGNNVNNPITFEELLERVDEIDHTLAVKVEMREDGYPSVTLHNGETKVFLNCWEADAFLEHTYGRPGDEAVFIEVSFPVEGGHWGTFTVGVTIESFTEMDNDDRLELIRMITQAV
jgi:hypothetical protein